MKLYSWNINGFRAVSAKPGWSWFTGTHADILAFQETKAEQKQVEGQVEESLRCLPGYASYWLAARRKGYSGVAVFSRPQPLAVHEDLPDELWRGEGRLLHLEYPAFHFMNVYFPNGQNGEERLQYKLGYYDAFLRYAEEQRASKPIVVCGDFNTAHKPIDIARPKENEETSGFLPIERAWMDRFCEAGYVDTFRLINGNKPDEYSWWSFRSMARERNVGWRIDYFFVSKELAPNVRNAWIEQGVYGSDHCPIGLELNV